MDYRTLDGRQREPTSYERELQRLYREEGVEDVYLDPEDTPEPWWQVADLLTHRVLMDNSPLDAHRTWERWSAEMRYHFGWPAPHFTEDSTYRALLTTGEVYFGGGRTMSHSVEARLAGIETMLDLTWDDAVASFADALNERARFFRVGFRLEGRRFVPVKSEHMHTTVVQPALLLLADTKFAEVDALYRKAFHRYLGSDAAGAITNAVSAVETLLRVGLGVADGDLGKLCAQAQKRGWVPPSVAETAKKLHALRSDSDVHTVGTDERELALFAIHVSGSVLLYLGETLPSRTNTPC